MSIANVILGQDIDPVWGNAVTDAINPTAYVTPTLSNSWVTMTNGNVMGYRKVNDRVQFKGGVMSGTVGSTTPIFTLPVGFRPNISAGHFRFFVSVSNGAIATVYVYGDGSVTLAAGSNAGLSLNGIEFDTA